MTTEPVQRKLHFIFDHYGIRPRTHLSFSYFSMANEVYFVEDTKGRRLVLKNCMKNRSRALLENEVAWMEHLNRHGVPTARVVPTKDGATVVEADGDFWLMCTRLRGHMPSWETRLRKWHIRGAIEGLGRIHNASASFQAPHPSGRLASWDYEGILAWTQGLADALAAPGDHQGRPSTEKMRQVVPVFLDWARHLREIFPPDLMDQCERTWVHGDFHSFNMVFRWHRFAACYDFDFIRADLKLFDISWTLRDTQRFFYFRKFGDKMWRDDFVPSKDEVAALEYEALRWFVREYRRHHPLSAREVSLLPAMAVIQALHNLRFFSLSNSEAECLDHAGWYGWIIRSTVDFGDVFVQAAQRVARELDPDLDLPPVLDPRSLVPAELRAALG